MERNPILSLRTADPLSRIRKRAVTEENIKQYFLLLEKTLMEKGLLNKASRIYNMDETGMPLDAKPLKRVALRGARKVQGPSTEINLKLQLWLVPMLLVVFFRHW